MHLSQLVPIAILVLLMGVLAKAALTDVAQYLIPHKLIGAAALLFVIYALVGGPMISPAGSMVVGMIALLAGIALFLMGAMGGGDAKLLAVLVMWAGPDEALPFLVVTSVLGGLLTLFVMSPWWALVPAGTPRPHVLAVAVPAGAAEFMSGDAAFATQGQGRPARKALAVPYGLAIAAAGMLMAAERVYLILSAP